MSPGPEDQWRPPGAAGPPAAPAGATTYRPAPLAATRHRRPRRARAARLARRPPARARRVPPSITRSSCSSPTRARSHRSRTSPRADTSPASSRRARRRSTASPRSRPPPSPTASPTPTSSSSKRRTSRSTTRRSRRTSSSTILSFALVIGLIGALVVVHRASRAGPDGRGDEHRALARQGLQHRQTENDVRRRRRVRRGEGRDQPKSSTS